LSSPELLPEDAEEPAEDAPAEEPAKLEAKAGRESASSRQAEAIRIMSGFQEENGGNGKQVPQD
jgi:hypothetical protein